MEKQGKRIRCPNCSKVVFIPLKGRCIYCGKFITEEMYAELPEEVSQPEKHEEVDEITYELPKEVSEEEPKPPLSLIFRSFYFYLFIVVVVAAVSLKVFMNTKPDTGEVTIEDSVIIDGNDEEKIVSNTKITKEQVIKHIRELMLSHYKRYGNFPPILSTNLDELSEIGDIKTPLSLLKNGMIEEYTLNRDENTEVYVIKLRFDDDTEASITDKRWINLGKYQRKAVPKAIPYKRFSEDTPRKDQEEVVNKSGSTQPEPLYNPSVPKQIKPPLIRR